VIHRRRKGLFAGSFVVSGRSLEAEAAAEDSSGSLLEDASVRELLVFERRADRLVAVVEDLDFIVVPVTVVQRELEAVEP
jgi:hypothetical protein